MNAQNIDYERVRREVVAAINGVLSTYDTFSSTDSRIRVVDEAADRIMRLIDGSVP